MAGATHVVGPETWPWMRALPEVRGGRCLPLSVLVLLLLCVSLFLYGLPVPNSLQFQPLPPLLPPESILPGQPRRGDRNIMFVETSCAVQDVLWTGLSARQACAVESAIRHNPSWQVYVLHTCALAGQLPDGAHGLHVPLADFLADTPLYEPLLQKGKLAASQWPVEHASDVMRFVALWKYGGIYLDMDVVVLRSLSDLGWDWAGAESGEMVASCILSMSATIGSAGQQVAAACIRALKDDFRGDVWAHNGPHLITKVLTERCGTQNTAAMTNCSGFRMLPATLLFPIAYASWMKFFSQSSANETLTLVQTAYTVHVWNKLSRDERITHPDSAYALIARENCPHTYSAANSTF